MSEKMREEFELFCDSIGYHYARDGDDYLGSYGKTMWMAWQASRAALVVELPPFENGSLRGYSGDCDEANMVVDAIAE